MNENPLVSVAMTCFNQEVFIKDAIKSIAIQNYLNWELVIVNDCSTDNSLGVIDKCIKDHCIQDKVRIITHRENIGYGYSLGEAIRESKGELVVILDSDDALAEDYSINVSVKAHLEHPEVAMTYSNYWECKADLSRKKIYKTKQIDNYFEKGGRISHLKVVKKKYYDMTEGINPKLKQTVDKDLTLKMEEVGKLFFIDQALHCYRLHVDNLSRSLHHKGATYREFVNKMRKQIYEDTRKRRAEKKK
ncbi:hypothetical protein LCGC14_0530260 [marine sediment metagenome]|uniref:Glycosyltransferase 2-like domain-containing protein n=1 Tax=marine sediment metagenome TaxID=412755 RepID=A0A0F9UH72_9ZZZZ